MFQMRDRGFAGQTILHRMRQSAFDSLSTMQRGKSRLKVDRENQEG
jgi:hypothetical protein